jgi:indoleamine 2,3-dioxygenase
MPASSIAFVLEDYDIRPDRGFLCGFDAASIALPDPLEPIERAGRELPDRLLTGRLRPHLRDLPVVDVTPLLLEGSDAQVRLAMVRYAFLVQAYVWGEPEPPSSLPAPLARPIVDLARHLGQKPLLPYSAYVLDNWDRFDRSAPIGLDNVYMIQHFAAGMDESWFVLVHVAIEARAGAALALVPEVLDAAARDDVDGLTAGLAAMQPVWADLNAIFDRMPEHCDPDVYFRRVRPYIHGWKDNPALGPGLVYEGVEELGGRPQAFRGQTGSQSSIVPTMDALLQVDHETDPLRAYLDELHDYRPPKHRAFIDRVRATSAVRDLATRAADATLTDAYDAVLEEVTRFRTRHLEYAARYIHKQARTSSGNVTEVGTGGTPFMRYLAKHRDESAKQLLGTPTSRSVPGPLS